MSTNVGVLLTFQGDFVEGFSLMGQTIQRFPLADQDLSGPICS